MRHGREAGPGAILILRKAWQKEGTMAEPKGRSPYEPRKTPKLPLRGPRRSPTAGPYDAAGMPGTGNPRKGPGQGDGK